MTDGLPASRPATLSDVAQRAGVSLATASKALNGRDDVSDRTRQRVLDAAGQMDFVPNAFAQSLVANRSRTVGLLTNDLVGRFVLPVLMGAEDAFGAGRIDVFLCDARGDAVREQHHLRALLSRRVDGIIVVGSQTDARQSLGHRLPVPVVYAYAPSEDPADVSFTPDNRAAGRSAAEHLLGLGKRRIVHISGEASYAAAQDRAEGVRDAMRAAGTQLVTDVLFSDWSERWGRDAVALLLQRHPDVDGIIAASDQIARGVLEMLRELGRAVPSDVSVVSFDNWEVLATESRPTISSIDFDLPDLGRAAARAVFDILDGNAPEPGVRHFPTRLVIRGSSVQSHEA
jgi:LacI family transcriptional regulator